MGEEYVILTATSENFWKMANTGMSIRRSNSDEIASYVTPIVCCHVADVCLSEEETLQFWDTPNENMSEHILEKARIQLQIMDLRYYDIIFSKTLVTFEGKISNLGGSGLQFLGLPQPIIDF